MIAPAGGTAIEDRIVSALAVRPRAAALLKRKPGIVSTLAVPVGLYSRGGSWGHTRMMRAQGRAIPVERLVPKARRLAKALAVVDATMRDADIAGVLQWTAARDPAVRAAGGLGRWLEALAEIRTRAEKGASLPLVKRRGRPLDPEKERFARSVAVALLRCGVRPTLGRDVAFHDVLCAAFEAAGEDCADDVFRLAARALKSLRTA